jgi:UDP-N-acetylmuramate: L-alanyl-gamma-D-glutamyl-meso-diaminopimelate ligase
MDSSDESVVFFNKEVIEHKKLANISAQFVHQCFGNDRLQVISDKTELESHLKLLRLENSVLLLMSSGNFAGINIKEIFH